MKNLPKSVEEFEMQYFGRTKKQAHSEFICISCGEQATKFRDGESENEYVLSGHCQKCQDEIYGSESGFDL